MEMILIGLIVSTIGGYASYNFGIESILNTVFFIEKEFFNMSITGLELLFELFLGYGISLIILKFLKKGFDIYILELEGDPDLEPLILLTNFFRAMAVAMGFPVIYRILVDIFQEASDQIFAVIKLNDRFDFDAFLLNVGTGGLFNAILFLVFFVIFIYLQFKFLMIGLELFILRIGLPLASSGLMDADKGVFKPYIQKFIQSFFTVLIQVTLAKFGFSLMLNLHVFWGIATLMLAVKTPRFLQEFLITSSGGGMNSVYHSFRMVQMARTAFKGS
jgi:hypothetical protein